MWPSLLLVDLDMTLIDTLNRFYVTFKDLLRVELGWEEFIRLFREDRLDELVPEPREAFWIRFTRELSLRRTPMDRVYPGVQEALSNLSCPKVVVTGRHVEPELIWDELMEFGISHLFSGVYTGYGEGWRKDPTLMRALKDYGVKPEDAVLVGDYWVDVASAKSLGLWAIAVRTGLEPDDRLMKSGADMIVDGIWELGDALSKLRRGLQTST